MPATTDDAKRLDDLRTMMRGLVASGDIGSVKEMAKSAYAEAVKLRNALRPHEAVFGVATEVMQEFLIASGRLAVNDSEFVIELEPEKSKPSTDEVRLYDMLHAMRIDDEPIPVDLLREAAYIDLPPPPVPMKRTNLTKIKPLEKRFGKPVTDAIAACVTRIAQPRRLIFMPKEKALDGE